MLVAVGAMIVAAGLRQERDAAPPVETAALSLDGAGRARLVLKHGAGVLEVVGAATEGELFHGTSPPASGRRSAETANGSS